MERGVKGGHDLVLRLSRGEGERVGAGGESCRETQREGNGGANKKAANLEAGEMSSNR